MKDYIAFPKLGLEFNISDTIAEFKLFGVQFSLKWYGLLIAIGFLLAVIYAMRRAKYFEIDPDAMIDVVLVSALFAFIGARLYYVVFSEDRSYYFSNPANIFKVWEGGLAIYGGIIFAFVTGIWMCRLRKVNTLAMFDIASLGFLIGQSIGRWGNFFNQEAFGTNTELPWGMTGSVISYGYSSLYDTDLPVHPTFLYESLWCALGFLLLHLFSKKAYKYKGQIFSLYIIWYGIGRFFIEGLRTDSLMLGASLRVSQVVAGLSVLGGGIMYFYLRYKHNSLPVDLFATAEDGSSEEAEETLETEDSETAESIDETNAEDAENTADNEESISEEIEPDNEAVEPAPEVENSAGQVDSGDEAGQETEESEAPENLNMESDDSDDTSDTGTPQETEIEPEVRAEENLPSE